MLRNLIWKVLPIGSRELLQDKSGIASQLYYSNYLKEGVWSWEIH